MTTNSMNMSENSNPNIFSAANQVNNNNIFTPDKNTNSNQSLFGQKTGMLNNMSSNNNSNFISNPQNNQGNLFQNVNKNSSHTLFGNSTNQLDSTGNSLFKQQTINSNTNNPSGMSGSFNQPNTSAVLFQNPANMNQSSFSLNNSSTNSAVTGSKLFGNNTINLNNNQTPQNSLFGNINQNKNTGSNSTSTNMTNVNTNNIFSSNNNAANNQSTASLFTNNTSNNCNNNSTTAQIFPQNQTNTINQTMNQVNNLFGNNNSTTTNSSNNASTTTNPQGNSSLFKNNLGNSLFGNNNSSNNNISSNNASGLFNNQQQTSNNSLFSNNNQALNAPTSNSIFGGQNTSNNNQQPNTTQTNSLFGNSTNNIQTGNSNIFQALSNLNVNNPQGAKANTNANSNQSSFPVHPSNSIFSNQNNQQQANNNSSNGLFDKNINNIVNSGQDKNSSLFGNKTIQGQEIANNSSNQLLLGNNNNLTQPNPTLNKSSGNSSLFGNNLSNVPASNSPNFLNNNQPKDKTNLNATTGNQTIPSLFQSNSSSTSNPISTSGNATNSLFGQNKATATTTASVSGPALSNFNSNAEKNKVNTTLNPKSTPIANNSNTTSLNQQTSLFGKPQATANPTQAGESNNTNTKPGLFCQASTTPSIAGNIANTTNNSTNTSNINLLNAANSTNNLGSKSKINTNITTAANQSVNPASNNNSNHISDSKSKIHHPIYPMDYKNGPFQGISHTNNIPYENNLESRKNILGISRSEISDRVIEAISKKMSIKEFFIKASEDINNEYRSAFKNKNKKAFSRFEMFDESFAQVNKNSYLETKYHIYLQKQMLRQKELLESTRRVQHGKSYYDRTPDKSENFYNRKFYQKSLEKNYDQANSLRFNFNYRNSPSALINGHSKNFNQRNFDLIKILNDEIPSATSAAEKATLNQENKTSNILKNLAFNDPKKMLLENDDLIDIYNPSFWQAKTLESSNKKTQAAESSHLNYGGVGAINKHLQTFKNSLSKIFSMFQENEGESQTAANNTVSYDQPSKIVNLIAEIKGKDFFLPFQIHKDSKIETMKDFIIEKLIERNMSKFSGLKKDNLFIIYKNSILVDDSCLKNYDFEPNQENYIAVTLIKDTDEINKNNIFNNPNTSTSNGLAHENSNGNDLKARGSGNKLQYLHRIGEKSHPRKRSKSPFDFRANGSNNANQARLNSNKNKGIKETSIIEEKEDYFPIYNCEFELFPNIKYIYRMTKQELKGVEGFKISNCFGKIKFKGKVNLAYLNLSEIVKIDKFCVELYPGKELPKPGEGLNVPAIVTLKQMFNQEENITSLIKGIKNNGRFIKYKPDKGYFIFEVNKWEKA